MRILHIGAYCGYGGVETSIAVLARQQAEAGLKVEAFYFVDLGGESQYEGVCPITFASRRSLTEVLLQGDYDLIHVVADAAASAERCLLRAIFRGAVVVTCHGAFTGNLGSEYVTAVSGFTAESIQGKCSRPVQVVHNGIDTSRFHPYGAGAEEGKPQIAWVGRSNDPYKDLPGLIALASSAAASGFRFRIVDGSPRDDDISIWLPEDAEVVRRRQWTEMAGFYREVAASGGFLLSTSSLEACPMNILEAQACGCPVLAPAVGGIPEIVEHQRTGYLYDRHEGVRGVRAAMDWLYAPGRHEWASESAAECAAERFSAERMAEQYMGIYKRAAVAHRPTPANRTARRTMGAGVACVRALMRRKGDS